MYEEEEEEKEKKRKRKRRRRRRRRRRKRKRKGKRKKKEEEEQEAARERSSKVDRHKSRAHNSAGQFVDPLVLLTKIQTRLQTIQKAVYIYIQQFSLKRLTVQLKLSGFCGKLGDSVRLISKVIELWSKTVLEEKNMLAVMKSINQICLKSNAFR